MKETLYYGGDILTMEGDNPKAVLTRDGIITAVGEYSALRTAAPDADRVDLKGCTMLPAFIDGHSHLTATAYSMTMANLNPPPVGSCSDVEDVVRICSDFLKEHPIHGEGWLMGMGYDNTCFPQGFHPTKEDLDRVSCEIPVIVIHASGHLAVVNTRGMELLGYGGEGYSVPGGGVVTSHGLLKEQAFLSPEKQKKIQGPTAEDVLQALGAADDMYASNGFATVQDGRCGAAELGLLLGGDKKGSLKTDVVAYLTPDIAGEHLVKGPKNNSYAGNIRCGGCKIYLDGSPQGKTAWLSAPYKQPPEGEDASYCGFPVMKEADVLHMMEKCVKEEWQLNAHANGDAAIEQMIDCYENVLSAADNPPDLRPVIIHCQTVRHDQLERMKQLGMLPSFFLDHVYYWGDYHRSSVLGEERAENISPAAWARQIGLTFTMHQDTPVVPPNTMLAIHNAVNRRTKDGAVLGEE